METSRLTRDGNAETVSRDKVLTHERGQGNIHFLCSDDHEQDWNVELQHIRFWMGFYTLSLGRVILRVQSSAFWSVFHYLFRSNLVVYGRPLCYPFNITLLMQCALYIIVSQES